MNPFWILGAAGIVLLLYLLILDRERSKSFQRGLREGYDQGVRDGFREGQSSKEQTWWDQAEIGIDQERKEIWKCEPKSGKEEEKWP